LLIQNLLEISDIPTKVHVLIKHTDIRRENLSEIKIFKNLDLGGQIYFYCIAE